MSRAVSLLILLVCIIANVGVIAWQLAAGTASPWLLLNVVAALYSMFVFSEVI